MLIDGDVVEGAGFEQQVERMLANPKTSYLHVHNAQYDCHAARTNRA